MSLQYWWKKPLSAEKKCTAAENRHQGYLVVISKNKGKEQEEDYIDLVPILENLLIDPVPFLDPIKEVKIRYA